MTPCRNESAGCLADSAAKKLLGALHHFLDGLAMHADPVARELHNRPSLLPHVRPPSDLGKEHWHAAQSAELRVRSVAQASSSQRLGLALVMLCGEAMTR